MFFLNVSQAVSQTAEGIQNIEFKPEDFVASLPDMALGMLGIFAVIGAIILVTYGLGAIFSKKK